VRIRVHPGGSVTGSSRVPGDKSIAHRWLILAATARGRSRLVGLPRSLDVRSTAACLAEVAERGRPALEAWSGNDGGAAEGHGSTWNDEVDRSSEAALEVEGEGRQGLTEPASALDCGNSGTTMRLLAGTLASVPFRSTLIGDDSLSSRPMERVAIPLRSMGATIVTQRGHPPLEIAGGPLYGISYRLPVATAQVKGAILLAGAAAEGETILEEPAATRDHTERALAALGAPVTTGRGRIVLQGVFQHDAFAGTVPGDVSSAAFLVAAAALTGSELTVRGVGLNPSRLHFLRILERMGVRSETRTVGDELGEPVGDLRIAPGATLAGTEVTASELPLVIDEVPILAVLAAHARGESWFVGAAELRTKETDRLTAIAEGLRSLGGDAAVEGDDLVVPGLGLRGGTARANGDHRLAMAFAVAAVAADGPCEIDGMEAADVSFPGFVRTLASLGASLEVLR
jgi:3-phosphoshikimate 1-carboxyvinyltransferase